MHKREVYFASPSTSVHRKKDSSPLIVSLEHIAKTRKQPWRGSPSWCSYPPCHPDTKSDNCLKSHTPLPGFVRKTTRNHVTPSSTVTRKRFVSSLYLGSIRMQTSPLLNRLRVRCGLFDSCHEPIQFFCSLQWQFHAVSAERNDTMHVDRHKVRCSCASNTMTASEYSSDAKWGTGGQPSDWGEPQACLSSPGQITSGHDTTRQ